MVGNKKALLVCYGGGHVNMIVPLYHELIKRGVKVDLLGLTVAQGRLKQENIEHFRFKDFIEDRDEDAIKLGFDLIKKINIKDVIDVDESAAYMGVSYSELQEQFGIEGARQKYQAYGRQCFLPIKYATRILLKLQPDFILTTNSPRMEKAFIISAKKLNIPAFCTVDFGDACEIKDRLSSRDYCNKVYVAFPATKQKLLNSGRQNHEIMVSGNPAFDYLTTINHDKARKELRQKLGINGKTVVLWAKSNMPDLYHAEEKIEECLANLLIDNSKVVVLHRAHPNSSRAESKHFSKSFIPVPNYKLAELLPAIDVAVTINSSIGVEAFILKKKVLQVLLYSFSEQMSFDELGIGKEIFDLQTLRNVINEYSRHPHYKVSPFEAKRACSEIICNDILETFELIKGKSHVES